MRKLSQTEYECELMEMGKGVVRQRLWARRERERQKFIIRRVLQSRSRNVDVDALLNEMENVLPNLQITDQDLREELERRAR